MYEANANWEPITKIDPARRKPIEWARIYNIQLLEPITDALWNEYEWAYNMLKIKYVLLPDKNGDFENATEMELRAMELNRDIFMGGDMGERHVLQNRYIETEWIQRRLSFM